MNSTSRSGRLSLLLMGPLLIGACDARSARDGELAVRDFTRPTYFEADSLIHDIRDLRVTETGSVWAVTGLEPFLYRWDASGRLRGRYGRRGGGPGEFLNPVRLAPGFRKEEPVIVWDPARVALLAVDTLGNAVRGWKTARHGGVAVSDIADRTHGDPFRLRRLGNRFLRLEHSGTVSEGGDLRRSMLVAIDTAGTSVDTVLALGSLLEGPSDDDEGMGQMLTALPLWTTCGGAIVVYDPYPSDQQQLLWLAADGTVEARTELPVSPPVLTDTDIRRYLTHRTRLESPDATVPDDVITRLVETRRGLFGRPAPSFVDLRCGRSGDVWLQAFSTDTHPLGYGRDWWIVDRDGPRSRARFPRGFRPYWIGEDRIVGIHTDDLGLQHVAMLSY